ncbi:hypothetical protein GS451_21745 [Rhodococcus hoagii]|nr:hypothetical protein [Prescottella equi]
MQDPFVARSAWACPAGRVGRQGFLHPVEFVVDGGAFDEHRGRELCCGRERALPLAFGVVAAAVAILPQSNQSWGRLDGCHDVGEGVAGPGLPSRMLCARADLSVPASGAAASSWRVRSASGRRGRSR